MYIQSECTVQTYTDYAFCMNIWLINQYPLCLKTIEEHVLLKENNILPTFHRSVLQLLSTLQKFFGTHEHIPIWHNWNKTQFKGHIRGHFLHSLAPKQILCITFWFLKCLITNSFVFYLNIHINWMKLCNLLVISRSTNKHPLFTPLQSIHKELLKKTFKQILELLRMGRWKEGTIR